VLAGSKDSVILVEALAQVACKLFRTIVLALLLCLVNVKCEVKNSKLELLPIICQSTEVMEAVFSRLFTCFTASVRREGRQFARWTASKQS
jgi:hypothetical protein